MFVEIRNPFAVELLNYRVTHFENYPEKAYSRWRRGRADWTQVTNAKRSNHSNSDPLGRCEAILGAVDFLGYGIGPVNICAYLFFNTDQLYVFLTKSRLR